MSWFSGSGSSAKKPLISAPPPSHVNPDPGMTPPDPPPSLVAGSTAMSAAVAARKKQQAKAAAGTSLITAPPLAGPQVLGTKKTLVGY